MTKSNSKSVTRQLQVVFAISILILLVSSYASFYTNSKLIDTSQLVDHTNEVILEAEFLISRTKDAETGQRGFLLTGNPIFLEPYNGAYEEVIASYERLKTLTLDNPVQQKYLVAARLMIDNRFRQMQNVLEVSNVNHGVGDAASIKMNSQDQILKGKNLMDDLRKIVEDIKTEENRLLKIRKAEQERFIAFTPVMVILAAVLAILISIFAYLRIKSDLDERAKKQKEEQDKYDETSKRIANLETITRKISGGDYTVRSNDDTTDELGKISIAMNNMAASLQESFTDLERRNWLQEGTVNINIAMTGEKYVKQLANRIIHTVAQYLKAPVATLYLADNNMNLSLAGAFAATDAPQYLNAGEGLTGQAVLSKQLIITNELPADYLSVSSSIGHTNAVHVAILPLVYEGEVIAVMELGFLKQPGKTQLALLERNAEAMAIGINTAVNYEKIQNLLEETQAQSEELQAQHTELENINTELQAQSEKLQASEEELRVQQEALQEANQELEERTRLLEEKNYLLTETTTEVQQKAEELAQSTKYKSEFLANMSHELRTPLNSILLLSRLLTENNEKTLSKDQVEYAKVIQNSGYGLLTLIDEILDLSKIEAGKMELEYEPVSIQSIVSDISGLFDAVAREKNIGFNITTADDIPGNIETDKLRLEQILRNLVSNAIKFTTDGAVTVAVRRHDKATLCFEVRDTGIGIPADKQKLIFEAFQQADGSTRRKYGGTGLGLSICRELVKLLGGHIDLTSIPGEGSVFYVYIPVSRKYVSAPPVVVDKAPTAESMPVVRPKENKYITSNIPESIPDDRTIIKENDSAILIIEDDTAFAKSLLDYTRKSGYKGIVAVRGDEGVELARRFTPRGILLDLELPVKNGWEVMDELKKDVATKHIPIHMMSSHAVKKESLIKGAIDFVDKPMAYEQMQSIFHKLEAVLNRTSKKVLIVEENPKHAKALAYFLETFNINAEIRNSVEESVSALGEEADCVILDMGIPDQKAYDMLEEVKKRPGMEHVPIIIFTGKSLSLSEEQKIKKYADSIVVKTANSYKRILDEVALFLHLVEENPRVAGGFDRKAHGLNEVLKDKTVLVVDDDVRNIFSLTKSLEAMQMKIVTAVNGKEAIAKMNSNEAIDIVLLDMMMPEMDGYETAKTIRQESKWEHLPIIAVTAKAMTGDREKCIKAGASDYISKPVDIDQLLSLLRVWLYEKA